MKKATMRLFDVNTNFKVKFTTFISSEPFRPSIDNKMDEAVNKFTKDGNTYYTINPKSYVVVDISTKQDKGENYSTNTAFYLDRRKLLFFILKLEKLYRVFTEEKSLFIYDVNKQNRLVVNNQIAEKYKTTLQVCGNKMLEMAYCVLDDENSGQQYEAIYIAVNSLNYNSIVTYDQLYYLIYELKKIDFASLELNLFNLSILYEKEEGTPIKLKDPIPEQKSEEIIDVKKRVHIEEAHTIPDI